MKKVPSLLTSILIILFTQCGDDLKNPNYPVVPSIAFTNIEYKDSDVSYYNETLKLTFMYRDGDSDLGLNYFVVDDMIDPYHPIFLYLEDATGDTIPFIPELIDDQITISSIPKPGTLITASTREKPNYGYLPEYNPSLCGNYFRDYTGISVLNRLNILDESFDIRDTVTINREAYAKVYDPIFYTRNKNHFNIFIEFYVFRNGSFEKYDFITNFCMTHSGRFPLILDNTGTISYPPFEIRANTPWEGEITYSMIGPFLPVFGNDRIKISITIKDRALHTSNTVVTEEFTLHDIR